VIKVEKVISISRARPLLNKLVKEIAEGGEPIIIAQRDEAGAMLVNREEYESLKDAVELLIDSDFAKSIKRGEADLKAGRIKPWRKVRKDV